MVNIQQNIVNQHFISKKYGNSIETHDNNVENRGILSQKSFQNDSLQEEINNL